MTSTQFIQKWSSSTLKESSAAQSHFNDLCALLGEPTPTEVDPGGSWFTFEQNASMTGGGIGTADVWKRGFFLWEYKGKGKDLTAAFMQLRRYAIGLQNPPILVVSDMETIEVHTNFTNTVEEIYRFTLQDLAGSEACRVLKLVFTNPKALEPSLTRATITKQAAEAFGRLAQNLYKANYEPLRVAHFVNKLVFCMFAEHINILPASLFSHLLERSVKTPDRFVQRAPRYSRP